VAHIYWPQVHALQVLALANRLYGMHRLSASDGHTIDCVVTRGVTYVPIPSGAGENFAGLFTVDLPTTVTSGQEFDIVVRRVATRRVPIIEAPKVPEMPRIAATGSEENGVEGEVALLANAPGPAMRNWRYVVGTFQVRIPVTTSEVMLRPEENTLAIMKWRLTQLKLGNRWRPVLERYISYVAARVDGLGGDSTAILPSPNGVPLEDHGEPSEHEYSGNVCEVLFDCFGDFEGFVLSDCYGRRVFRTRQHGIGEIVLRACRQRLLLSVCVEGEHEHRIRGLAIRR
jgi:hypothetical protein